MAKTTITIVRTFQRFFFFFFPLVIVALPSPSFSADNQKHFENPWTLQRKAGSPVEVVDVTFDSDVNGDPIIIYTTTTGEEGFADISNVENIDELNRLMGKETSESTQSNPPPSTDSSYSDNGSGSSSSSPPPGSATSASTIVALLNSMYGNICTAELNGFFSKTLKIDWTSNTNKLAALKVIAEIGTVKESHTSMVSVISNFQMMLGLIT